MNYQKIYDSIITKAKHDNRKKLKKDDDKYVYYEKHHIIPKCINGDDNEHNLVLLTAKEHFICHKLLTYIYKGNRKIVCAFYRLSHDKRERNISSKDYAYAKQLMSIVSHTPETKHHISLSLTGKTRSIESINNQRKTCIDNNTNKGSKNPMFGVDPWNKGKTHVYSEETLVKFRRPKSEEHKLKLKKPKSDEHKLKLRKSNNKVWVCNKNKNVNILIDKSNLDIFLKNNADFHRGRIISDKQKIKQSNSMKGKIPWNKKLSSN